MVRRHFLLHDGRTPKFTFTYKEYLRSLTVLLFNVPFLSQSLTKDTHTLLSFDYSMYSCVINYYPSGTGRRQSQVTTRKGLRRTLLDRRYFGRTDERKKN